MDVAGTRVRWDGGEGVVIAAGKHGVVVEKNGRKVKLFWGEVTGVGKGGLR